MKASLTNYFNALLSSLKENRILSALFALISISALVKILGFVEKILLAKYIGTGYQADVYMLLFAFVFSIFIVFRELIEPGFLNVFTKANVQGDRSGSKSLFNVTLRVLALLILVFSAFIIVYPSILTAIIAPGFEGNQKELSNQLVQLMIPALLFMVLSNVTKITLNGLKIFALPASADLVFKLGIIAGLIVFFNAYGILAVAIGVVAGAVGKLLVHFTKLFSWLSFKRESLEKAQLQQLWKLTWPLLIGAGFSQLSVIIDNALASTLQEGAISSLSYSKKIMETPLMFFSEQLGIILFPYFAQFAYEKNKNKLIDTLNASLHWVMVVFIPVSVYFVVCSTNIVELIYERGAFDADSTLLTVKPFALYSVAMVVFAFDTIITVFYFGTGNTKTPIFVGIYCVIVNIVLTFILIKTIGYIGIPIAYAIQKTLKVSWLLVLLKHRSNVKLVGLRKNLPLVLLSGLLFAAALVLFKTQFDKFFTDGFIQQALFLGLCFALPGGMYLFALKKANMLNVKLKQ